MRRTRTRALCRALLVLVAATATSSAAAEEPAWNQEQVTALAEKLAHTLDEVVAATRAEPPQDTALQQRTRDASVNRLDRVSQAANELASKLRAGWDRDATVGYFRNFQKVFRETGRIAGDAVPREAVSEKLDEAIETVKELSRYYPDA